MKVIIEEAAIDQIDRRAALLDNNSPVKFIADGPTTMGDIDKGAQVKTMDAVYSPRSNSLH